MQRWVWFLACAACGNGVGGAPERQTLVEIPAAPAGGLDLLFVIDDSGNTADLQFNLSAALPTLFDRLANLPGGLPDLHVGVITSDLGTATSTSAPAPDIGAVGTGGCSGTGKGGNLTLGQATVSGAFLEDIALPDGTRQRNYNGDLADVTPQMVKVGSTGCGFEQPLASMRAALDANPNNAGFSRPDATLAIILLMDEDDCSVRDPALFGPDSPSNPLLSFRCTRFGLTCLDGGNTPDEMDEIGIKGRCGPNTSETALLDQPARFHDFLVDLKGNSRRVVVGGLIGDPEPVEIETRTIGGAPHSTLAHSCTFEGPDNMTGTSDDQNADPGVRLQAFADLFGDRGTTASMCQNDLSGAIEQIGQRIAFATGSPCIEQTLVDADAEMIGLQPDCIVEDRVGEETTLIPSCPASPTCWTIVPDEATCAFADHLKLEITRESPVDPNTITRARCATL